MPQHLSATFKDVQEDNNILQVTTNSNFLTILMLTLCFVLLNVRRD